MTTKDKILADLSYDMAHSLDMYSLIEYAQERIKVLYANLTEEELIQKIMEYGFKSTREKYLNQPGS